MNRLSYKGKIFTLYEYRKESDFERDVIEYSKEISDQIEINGA